MDTIESLQARVKELEAALKPFAEFSPQIKKWKEMLSFPSETIFNLKGREIKDSDIHHAAAVLGEAPETEKTTTHYVTVTPKVGDICENTVIGYDGKIKEVNATFVTVEWSDGTLHVWRKTQIIVTIPAQTID